MWKNGFCEEYSERYSNAMYKKFGIVGGVLGGGLEYLSCIS